MTDITTRKVPILLNYEQFKEMLPKGKYAEEETRALFKFVIRISESELCSADYFTDSWRIVDSFFEIASKLEKIFSFHAYCNAMNLNKGTITKENVDAFKELLYWKFLYEFCEPVDEDRYLINESQLDDLVKGLDSFRLLQRLPKKEIGLGYEKIDGDLVFTNENILTDRYLLASDPSGKNKEIWYKSAGPLRCIFLTEDDKVDLDGVHFFTAFNEDYDYQNEDVIGNSEDFFGCRMVFHDRLKIEDANKNMIIVKGNTIVVYRYGECGCIIQPHTEYTTIKDRFGFKY